MPGSLPCPKAGTVIQRTHPSRSICPPRPPAETPQAPSHRQEQGRPGEKGLDPPRQESVAKETVRPSNPQTAHQADPSCLGPHLGPQGRWLVRSTRPISPHVRALPVQEGRVPDISEVSAQVPLGLPGRGTGNRGGRGESREADSEPEADQAWPGQELTSQKWGPGVPTPPPTRPTHTHSARLS